LRKVLGDHESITTENVADLVSQIKGNQNQMDAVTRYANGHLFRFYESGPRTSLVKAIAEVTASTTEKDWSDFDLYAERVKKIAIFSAERNCYLYADAEQTWLQDAVESQGQQIAHEFHKGDKVMLMNAFQCYLKRMKRIIPMEILASKQMGFNLGIKCIRGAYMDEERNRAAKEGRESPVWDTIEDTHACYNGNVEAICTQMTTRDRVMFGSHNAASVTMIKDFITEKFPEKKKAVFIAQLYGFSDNLTYGLREAGFEVKKYVPYGPYN